MATGEKLRVTLFGELTLAEGARSLPLPASRKTRALFAYLLRCGTPVRRERLCETFFDIPDDPRAALRWSLSKIRTMLGAYADGLISDRDRVELVMDGIVTDVDEAERLLSGRAASKDAARLSELAHAAIDTPLAGLDLPNLEAYSAWLSAERSVLDGVRARLFERAAEHADFTAEQQQRFAGLAEELGHPVSGDADPDDLVEAPRAENPVGQSVHYTIAPDGVRIAYACTGAGPPLVKAANWLNHLELDWTGPVWSRLFTDLSRRHTLVRYDERGNGLSDWEVDDLSFEAFVRDLECVVEALELERFPLLGISQGCAVSIEYAARHPEKVSHLILLGGYAAGWRHTASPEQAEAREAVITLARHGWGQDNPVYRQLFTQTFIPEATKEELDWFNDFQRATATPANAADFLETFSRIDVRDRLADVRAPTLVLHARGDQRVPLYEGIQLAAAIKGASLVTLETGNHIPLSREPATDHLIQCVEAFLNLPDTRNARRDV